MLKEMLALLIGSIPIFAAMNQLGFSMTCLGAVVLASLFWWLCSVYTRLWNLSFYLNWFHLFLCSLAAASTVFLVIAFVSVGAIGQAFDKVVTEWGMQMHSIYSNVDGQLSSINVGDLRSQFESAHPFLRDVIRTTQTASDELTDKPAANSAAPDSESNSDGETIDQTVSDLKNLLLFHVDRVVFRLRAFLLLSFLLVQFSVFAVTGYAAHRDIRP